MWDKSSAHLTVDSMGGTNLYRTYTRKYRTQENASRKYRTMAEHIRGSTELWQNIYEEVLNYGRAKSHYSTD